VFVFLATSSWDDHTARLRRALICAGRNVLSLSLNKESTKESQPGRSLRDLPISRRFMTNGGALAFVNVLHLRGIYPTPQMGLADGKISCYPVGEAFRLPFEWLFAFVAGGYGIRTYGHRGASGKGYNL
jgi:hypothetical protein